MVPMPVLFEQCAPNVSPALMGALVHHESAGKPFSIGMDATQGAVRQPATLEEAVATARSLDGAGRTFSVGLAQVHVSNVRRSGLSWEQAFDPCRNLALGQQLLWNFYHRATAAGYSGSGAVWAALRGYNAGGIDRRISDGYASRIFTTMGGHNAKTAPVETRLIPGGVPAPESWPAMATQGPSAMAVGSPAAARSPARTGESLDIFEKPGWRQGF